MTDPPPSFSFALDTDISFGPGSRAGLPEAALRFGRRVALVTGAGFEERPHAAELLEGLARAGVEVVAHERASGEPDDGLVRDVAARLAVAAPDAVIGIGGGSPLDLAKAAAVVAAGGDLDALLGGATVAIGGSVPVIALPTTAGTGSEVSRAAIVLHRSARRKRGVRGRGVAARVAIVDPELVFSTGRRVTAESGFDAMAHALETGVSRAASPLNVLLAGDAVRRLLDAIPVSLAEPQSEAARTSAAYAALLMGVNLATASTYLPHRLQYPVGAMTGTSHPRGVAALMPSWLRRTERHAPDRLAALAEAAGIVADDEGASVRGLLAALDGWLDRIGMRTTLGELGVAAGDVRELVAMVEGSLHNDPGPVEPADLDRLYRESL